MFRTTKDSIFFLFELSNDSYFSRIDKLECKWRHFESKTFEPIAGNDLKVPIQAPIDLQSEMRINLLIQNSWPPRKTRFEGDFPSISCRSKPLNGGLFRIY